MQEARLLDRLFKYISCDSESGNEQQFCEMVEADLVKAGFAVSRDAAGMLCGSNGWNVYASMPGEGEPILFCAHLDTVTPGVGIRPVIESGVIRAGGDTILGADDKAGVAAILEAAVSIQEMGIRHRPVEVLFSICEEIGLKGSKHAEYTRIRSKQAVVLDSRVVGTVIRVCHQ